MPPRRSCVRCDKTQAAVPGLTCVTQEGRTKCDSCTTKRKACVGSSTSYSLSLGPDFCRCPPPPLILRRGWRPAREASRAASNPTFDRRDSEVMLVAIDVWIGIHRSLGVLVDRYRHNVSASSSHRRRPPDAASHIQHARRGWHDCELPHGKCRLGLPPGH